MAFQKGHKKPINAYSFQKGHPSYLTEESKKRIALANIGNKKRFGKKFPHTEETKKRISGTAIKKGVGKWMKGKKHSEETKKKMSDSQKGEKNPNWNNGSSFESYSIDWTETLRKSIRERDHYICQLCQRLQGDIAHDIHHIDYDKKNCDPKNLITLCHSCNVKVNSNRNYWKNYLNNLIKI